jgi:hypothetical protein
MTETQVAEADNILIHVPEGATLFYAEGMVDPADLERAGIKNPVPVIGDPREVIAFAKPEEER